MSETGRLLATLILVLPLFAWAEGPAEDYGGLPPGPGQVEVFGLCSACHSLMIVKQQGLSKQSWLDTLTWMTEEQGMAELPAEMKDRIATYLSEHYGVDRELPAN